MPVTDRCGDHGGALLVEVIQLARGDVFAHGDQVRQLNHLAVAAARKAFASYSQTTREERLALLGRNGALAERQP